MDSLQNIAKNRKLEIKKDPYLHTASHLLADELSTKLNDKKHFGFYLKMTTTMPHDVLRRLCGQVLESRTAKTPGRLFAYLIKQHNESVKAEKKLES
jgi:hypothetical protein